MERNLIVGVVGDDTILLLHVGIVPGGAVCETLVESLDEGQRTGSLEIMSRHMYCIDEAASSWIGSGGAEDRGDISGGLDDVVGVEGRPFFDDNG